VCEEEGVGGAHFLIIFMIFFYFYKYFLNGWLGFAIEFGTCRSFLLAFRHR